ncbi:MAG TPA: roadblock/LC7 domain-containing protein [Blastocatellia bacterium]|nr:roadblock/LC7 domain-containing protein [Blastocatellia bacterium]
MSFESILKEVVLGVDGATGAIFLDNGGEAVQWYCKVESDRLRLRAAYLAVVVQTCRSSCARLNLGAVSQTVLEYEGARLILEEIDASYFIVLELSSSANLAKAMTRLSTATMSLRREIAA